jgi:hypothetical protein
MKILSKLKSTKDKNRQFFSSFFAGIITGVLLGILINSLSADIISNIILSIITLVVLVTVFLIVHYRIKREWNSEHAFAFFINYGASMLSSLSTAVVLLWTKIPSKINFLYILVPIVLFFAGLIIVSLVRKEK